MIMDFPLNFKILCGTYLVIQWLKHRTSTTQGTIPSLVSFWELRSHKLQSMAEVKKEKKKRKSFFSYWNKRLKGWFCLEAIYRPHLDMEVISMLCNRDWLNWQFCTFVRVSLYLHRHPRKKLPIVFSLCNFKSLMQTGTVFTCPRIFRACR